ncbi:inorganic triphosphatase [Neptunomonas antarctica]|uniref:Adenylate cyclase n=1 Tax=Neptunomonas antarctica TaxID=619304 RepID=A0A1N7J0R7_9GAMM|nr:CYTH domain-containing protein [Neptunomonas antarctica]SIS42846.1 adenylate cyclase [Neptunomonas antarctica]
MATETEIKLLVPDQAIHKIAQLPFISTGRCEGQKRLINWYFDTSDLRLSANKMALRIREQNGVYIQTLKTKGQSVNGLHQRGEWEWIIDKPVLDLARLKETGLSIVDDFSALATRLQVIFSTHFDRTIWMVELAETATVIEVALDQGEVSYTSPEGRAWVDKICELELELKSGSVDALLAVAVQCTNAIPELTPGNISKAERGYSLFEQAKVASA